MEFLFGEDFWKTTAEIVDLDFVAVALAIDFGFCPTALASSAWISHAA